MQGEQDITLDGQDIVLDSDVFRQIASTILAGRHARASSAPPPVIPVPEPPGASGPPPAPPESAGDTPGSKGPVSQGTHGR